MINIAIDLWSRIIGGLGSEGGSGYVSGVSWDTITTTWASESHTWAGV
jgi:hypothetical protein